ncbi:discoidin domain-containing protein [Armatimonas rosea]|uniref:F5/8 type C domain-containing protein n=1 Tax=Armatimonas rosea TaxID=685828 RepID=A0A7W9SUK2_ARMRO|nr:discoidin domain-containing protein [Armatimonas rosea]MBB6052941.1 hypothetical protein [Armatimonas rosea]
MVFSRYIATRGFLAALTVVGLAALPQTAQAQRISGVTASSNMGSFSSTNIANTVNGVGLDSLSLTANHAVANFGDYWLSSFGAATGIIDFDLGGLYDVSGFSFWNARDVVQTETGIRGVAVTFSTNGSSFFSALGTPTEFAQATTSSATNAPEIFSFSPVSASYVRFTVTSNWGNPNLTGFNEVGFSGTVSTPSSVTPELPGAMQLLPALLPVALIGARKRFKKA